MYTCVPKELARGFTLIETLIAVSVFVFIASSLISQSRTFQSNVEAGNLAYEIALAIREAQVLGLGIRQFPSTFTTNAYGVHFDGPNTNALSFPLFLDRTSTANSQPNSRYDGSVIDPTIETFELRGGNQIVEICGQGLTGSPLPVCSVLTTGGPLCGIDIVFRRPDPAPNILLRLGTSCVNSSCTILGNVCVVGRRAWIRLSSLGGVDYTVEVTNTGQISVRR